MITIFFFFNDTATTEIYTLSLHDALPICQYSLGVMYATGRGVAEDVGQALRWFVAADRKSTRLNSSHLVISYAVFCLKKKKKTTNAGKLPKPALVAYALYEFVVTRL